MDTQKNRLNEMGTENICLNVWVRKYLQVYAEYIFSQPDIDYASPNAADHDEVFFVTALFATVLLGEARH